MTNGTSIAAAKPPSHMAQIQSGLMAMTSELVMALPKNITPERFISTAITGIRTSKDPKKLLMADRRSLYNAVQTAASYGLVLDGREAALVPFGDQVQFMPMVQGLVKLARNSGLISTIIAEVVYGKDKFSYRVGVDESPIHEPDWFAEDRGEAVGVWALVTLADGNKIHSIMPKSRVMEIAAGSKNAAQYNAKTGKHFAEWWKKTAIKNVLKYAPKASELEKLDRLANMDDANEGYDLESGEILDGKVAEVKPKRTGTRAAAKVKAEYVAIPTDDAGVTVIEENAQEYYPTYVGDTGGAGYVENSYDEDDIPV